MLAMRELRNMFGLCALTLLVLPGMAAAQSSTFVIGFERIGPPGVTAVCLPDPLNPGGPCIPTTVDSGAFVNPCTLENVDVVGTSTVSTVQTLDKFGTIKVNVSVVTKGTGAGWITLGTYTGSSYAFNDSQQFTFQLPEVGQEFSSDFSDKLAMKGAKSIDNWVIRAHFRIKVNAAGDTQVFMIKTNADSCKG